MDGLARAGCETRPEPKTTGTAEITHRDKSVSAALQHETLADLQPGRHPMVVWAVLDDTDLPR